MAREVVILITCPSIKHARKIGAKLVEERLAACANLIPKVESLFRWKGKICREGESLMIVKTTQDRFTSLSRRVRQLHPYTVPEIIALPIVKGSRDYLLWVRDMTR